MTSPSRGGFNGAPCQMIAERGKHARFDHFPGVPMALQKARKEIKTSHDEKWDFVELEIKLNQVESSLESS